MQLITLSPFSAFEPVGSQKQEEVRDGGRGKEEGFHFPARWPLTPLRVRLLSLPRLRRPHRYGPEYTPEVTEAPGCQGNHQREHQGGTRRRTPLRRLTLMTSEMFGQAGTVKCLLPLFYMRSLIMETKR